MVASSDADAVDGVAAEGPGSPRLVQAAQCGREAISGPSIGERRPMTGAPHPRPHRAAVTKKPHEADGWPCAQADNHRTYVR